MKTPEQVEAKLEQTINDLVLLAEKESSTLSEDEKQSLCATLGVLFTLVWVLGQESELAPLIRQFKLDAVSQIMGEKT